MSNNNRLNEGSSVKLDKK